MATYSIPKKKINKEGFQNIFKLYKFIKPYRVEYSFGMFFLLGSSLASLAFPKLLGELVNSGNEGKLSEDLNFIGLLLVITLLIQSVFSYFRTVLFVNVTEKTLAFLRQHTYNHLIKLPLRFFEKRRVGELNSRISSDISLLQETLTTTLAEFLRQIIIIIGGITLLVITSVKLTLFMLAILPAISLLSVVFGRFIRRFSKQVQNQVADSNTIVEETLQGIQSVKIFTNEFFEILRYKKRTEEIANIGMKSGRYRGAFSAFIIFGLFGAMVAVIWKGAILLSQGAINAGELFSFVIYSGFIGGTIGGLANVFTRIQRFIGATEDLFEIFEEKEESITQIDCKIDPKYEIHGNIEFKNLTFSYPSRPDEEVLKDVNLSISANQLVALVGPSGSGKSTIASLLLQLHTTENGQILFDRRNNSDFPISSLRYHITSTTRYFFIWRYNS